MSVRFIKSTIGFIGFGKMATALAKGALAAGVVRRGALIAYDHGVRKRPLIKSSGVKAATDLRDVCRNAEIVFLCVKPQSMTDVLTALRLAGAGRIRCVVSIAAGISLERLQRGLGKGVSVIRVMPNTPALVRAGMSAVSVGRGVRAADVRDVERFLQAVGDVVRVPETSMDAVTAVSGSGPAYVFLFAEALMAAANQLGLKAALSRRLVSQTVLGAGTMLARRPEDAAELRRQVTSKGGTTEAALNEFEKRRWRAAVLPALQKAVARAKQLKRGS